MNLNKKIQEITSKFNAKMYKKNYIPQPDEIYSRHARLIQHSKINKCNPSHSRS